MTSAKALSYNESRILWNEGDLVLLTGRNSNAAFGGESREDRVAFVKAEGSLLDLHDTFNSFWLVWGNWQEYKQV